LNFDWLKDKTALIPHSLLPTQQYFPCMGNTVVTITELVKN
jgi:hypothetical protein